MCACPRLVLSFRLLLYEKRFPCVFLCRLVDLSFAEFHSHLKRNSRVSQGFPRDTVFKVAFLSRQNMYRAVLCRVCYFLDSIRRVSKERNDELVPTSSYHWKASSSIIFLDREHLVSEGDLRINNILFVFVYTSTMHGVPSYCDTSRTSLTRSLVPTDVFLSHNIGVLYRERFIGKVYIKGKRFSRRCVRGTNILYYRLSTDGGETVLSIDRID